MNKNTGLWLGLAGALIVIGGIIFALVMGAKGWDFSKLSSSKYETNTHSVAEECNSVFVDTTTADVNIVPSKNGECKVECYERASARHAVSVVDGCLTVVMFDNTKWYEEILNFGTPSVTVYLPEAEYSSVKIEAVTGDVEIAHGFRFDGLDITTTTGDIECSVVAKTMKLKVTTGDIDVENSASETLDASLTTGDIELKNVACKNLTLQATTGDVTLNGAIASEKMQVKLTTGDVALNGCDGGEILIKTSTGDVRGSILTEKVIFATSDTGRVDVPHCTSGGRCEISTATGNIHITID